MPALPVVRRLTSPTSPTSRAFKVGAQYAFDFGLTASAIWEDLRRDVPQDLEFQNQHAAQRYVAGSVPEPRLKGRRERRLGAHQEDPWRPWRSA